MFADLDYAHLEVKEDLINWGQWSSKEVDITGIRFDAVKHFGEDFLREFIVKMDEVKEGGWFFVGEFWKDSLDDMSAYQLRMGTKFSLFDAPLVHNFSQMSNTSEDDMRTVFDGSLVQKEPINTVVSLLNDHKLSPSQQPSRRL